MIEYFSVHSITRLANFLALRRTSSCTYDDINCFKFTLDNCPDAMYSLNDSRSATFNLFNSNYTPGHSGCMNVCEFAMMRACLTTFVHTGWSSDYDNS